jgi:hypothetical protein
MPADDLIRFVTPNRHPPYGIRGGLFAVAYELRKLNSLQAGDHEELCALLNWFEENLKIPSRFTKSRYPRAKETAVSWVRADAKDHVGQLRRLAALVRLSGMVVDELRTVRPGYIVYQDEHQIVALPFSDTPQ